MSTTAKVATIPTCSFCQAPARYDFKTDYGPWGYGCQVHFLHFGGKLGMGLGQELILDT